MRTLALAAIGILLASHAMAAEKPAHSPYSGQEDREIKALAPNFIAGLKAGEGLGFAKSAELNGYPGPAHLLELASQIPLSEEQVQEITAIRDGMRRASIALGLKLIRAEAELEAAFRGNVIDDSKLSELTMAAGALRARLRATHLGAHIKAAALLAPRQIHRYEILRGYASGGHKGGGHNDGGHRGAGHKGADHAH